MDNIEKWLACVICSLILLGSISLTLADAVTGDVVVTVQTVGAEEEEVEVIEIEEYISITGEAVQLTKQSGRSELRAEGVSAESELEIEETTTDEGTSFNAELSSGEIIEVKIMPNTASERAIEALKLNACVEEEGCVIELKEVGKEDEAKLVYEVQAKKRARLLGFIPVRMGMKTQIDAESGEVIKTDKPWWAFIATGEDDAEEA